ncbi:hypothetical protein [Gordonia sp. (in: high G+C Gram-positive bacteria)]|uniref:hypothetical protein n=1 Tax=Gordonia sp. (in: high G+C Gram-positive bacteria) TaxID=84139 RepID=UPI003341EC42
MPDHLKPVRAWLRDVEATHVIIEGSRIPRRRLSVAYALTQLRNLNIVSVHVQHDRTGTSATVAGIDPVTQTVRTIAALSAPSVLVTDGFDEHGKPTHHHQPCEDT